MAIIIKVVKWLTLIVAGLDLAVYFYTGRTPFLFESVFVFAAGRFFIFAAKPFSAQSLKSVFWQQKK